MLIFSGLTVAGVATRTPVVEILRGGRSEAEIYVDKSELTRKALLEYDNWHGSISVNYA